MCGWLRSFSRVAAGIELTTGISRYDDRGSFIHGCREVTGITIDHDCPPVTVLGGPITGITLNNYLSTGHIVGYVLANIMKYLDARAVVKYR